MRKLWRALLRPSARWSVLALVVIGIVVGIALIVAARHGRNVPIPFGPYLAAAGVIALFWGQRITQGYLGLIA